MAGPGDIEVNTYYRRKAKARQEAALAFETVRRRTVLSRAEAFTRQLQAELAEAGRCHAIAAGIIGEIATFGQANAFAAVSNEARRWEYWSKL